MRLATIHSVTLSSKHLRCFSSGQEPHNLSFFTAEVKTWNSGLMTYFRIRDVRFSLWPFTGHMFKIQHWLRNSLPDLLADPELTLQGLGSSSIFRPLIPPAWLNSPFFIVIISAQMSDWTVAPGHGSLWARGLPPVSVLFISAFRMSSSATVFTRLSSSRVSMNESMDCRSWVIFVFGEMLAGSGHYSSPVTGLKAEWHF